MMILKLLISSIMLFLTIVNGQQQFHQQQQQPPSQHYQQGQMPPQHQPPPPQSQQNVYRQPPPPPAQQTAPKVEPYENNLVDDVFDWVFGSADDVHHREHELNEHFDYIRGANQAKDVGDLAHLAEQIGIRPEFFNFKAHDYDNNDRIDGLELLKMIFNEKHGHGQLNTQSTQYIDLCTKTIDRLLQQEDLNNDGFLDYTEYSKARLRIEMINNNKKKG